MTAGEIISRADSLRPNHYSAEQKLLWLQRLDGQINAELLIPRGMGQEQSLPYTGETELIAPAPYGEEVYLSYIFCQIDLNNAEIQKYNQSAALLSAAWRSLADSCNRQKMLEKSAAFKF